MPTRLSPSHLLILSVTLAAGLVAVPARADEPTEAPTAYAPDRYPDPSARGSILMAGAALTVGSYGIGVGTSYLWSDAPTAEALRLPVVGPMLAVVGAKCGDAERSSCGTFTVVLRTILATLSGIGQLGGVAVIAEGLFVPTAGEPVRSTVARSVEPGTPASWEFTPIATDAGVGFGVTGQF